ncbi:MAG: Uma2 family endonuclease [bacterium]|nr:Uma2 family endonuclease [bacterium]
MVDLERTRLTIPAFMELPPQDGIVELIDGAVIAHSPKYPHQRAALRFAIVMTTAVTTGEFLIAPMSVAFDDHNFPQPDIFWVSGADSACKLGEDGYWHGAPDFILEILSPGTEVTDRGAKYELYQRYGVREYWLAQPSSEQPFIEVYTRQDAGFARVGVFQRGESFTSPLFGASFAVADFFQD